MNGINGNSASRAYDQMSITAVRGTHHVARTEAGKAAAPKQAAAATVTISSEAQQLASAAEAQVDTHKIDALRAKIADGSFQIDHSKVATKMVRDLLR